MGSRVYSSGCLHTLEEACLTGLRHIQTDPLAPIVVLVPGNLLGLHLRRRLALSGSFAGHAAIRFLTLVDLAGELSSGWLLKHNLQRSTPLLDQLLLHQALSSVVPDGGYFAEGRGQEVFCRGLYETVTDLKEALIHPEELIGWARGFPPPAKGGHKLKELADIYQDHHRRLRAMSFVDRNDILEQAAEFKEGTANFNLVVYGFYDFNPLQRKFLEALLQRKQALVFFPWREGAAFDYALPTLTWLRRLGCEHVPLTPEKMAPLKRLAFILFESPEPNPPKHELEGLVSIISAPGERREVLETARECLRWVKENGLRFSDIGILLRNREPYASLFAETFAYLGIPHYLHEGSPLWKSRAGQSLRLLFKILSENFSRMSVMEFLTYAPLSFEPLLGKKSVHANPALWDLFSLEAGIVGGRKEWQERLERLHRRILWEEEEQKRTDGEKAELSAALPSLEAFSEFLHPFFDKLAAIPRSAHWSDFAQPFCSLMQKVLPDSPETQRVLEVVEGLSRLDMLKEEITLERFFSVAETVLGTAHERSDGFGEGIFIGELMSARGLSFKAVVVPGMVEKFFPRHWHQDPILLDFERQYLSEGLGKELMQKNRSYDEERLLFALAVMAAKERLLLSFPRLEPLSGKERIPSFYLLRLMEAAVGRPVSFSDLEGWEMLRRVALSKLFPGAPKEALDHLEYDLFHAEQAMSEKSLAPLSYLASSSPFFSRSLRAEAERWGEKRFTEFDGLLQSPKSRAHLADLYPQKNLTLSPTRLETYARCPYRYFLETLLGLAVLEEPDPFSGLSPLDQGALVHEILFSFLKRLQEESRLPLKNQELALLESVLMEVAEGALAEFEAEKATGFRLLWALKKAEILGDLKGWLKTDYLEEGEFCPAYLEYPFSCPLPLDSERAVHLKGRIDRIDSTPDQRLVRVIDYKTGRAHPIEDGEFRGGEALQLPVYLYAARTLFKTAATIEAHYYFATKKGRYRKAPFTQRDWEIKLATLRRILQGLTEGMRNGLFISHPSSCSPKGCSYPWICTPAAEVLYKRKNQDPRIESFERIKEIP